MAKKATTHSEKFAMIKTYYTRGLWSIERVKQVTAIGAITAEEYAEITGEAYE